MSHAQEIVVVRIVRTPIVKPAQALIASADPLLQPALQRELSAWSPK